MVYITSIGTIGTCRKIKYSDMPLFPVIPKLLIYVILEFFKWGYLILARSILRSPDRSKGFWALVEEMHWHEANNKYNKLLQYSPVRNISDHPRMVICLCWLFCSAGKALPSRIGSCRALPYLCLSPALSLPLCLFLSRCSMRGNRSAAVDVVVRYLTAATATTTAATKTTCLQLDRAPFSFYVQFVA